MTNIPDVLSNQTNKCFLLLLLLLFTSSPARSLVRSILTLFLFVAFFANFFFEKRWNVSFSFVFVGASVVFLPGEEVDVLFQTEKKIFFFFFYLFLVFRDKCPLISRTGSFRFLL